MIVNFGSKGTEDLFHGNDSKEARKIPVALWPISRRKLDMVNAAVSLADLRIPPANRLETLKGDLKGRFSIRINDRYRIVFRFHDGNAYDVEVVDYH